MTEIIVIGAGVSALSACASLSEAGLNNFVILEANDRIGGRMHTIPFGMEIFFLNYFTKKKKIFKNAIEF
jgi:spermine oxidase